MVGRNATTKRLYVYYGDGTGGFGATRRLLSCDWGGYPLDCRARATSTSDGHPDLIARGADEPAVAGRRHRRRLGARTAAAPATGAAST